MNQPNLPSGPWKKSDSKGLVDVFDATGEMIAEYVPPAVADLLLTAERENDATPVDEAWLRSVGFTEYGTFIDGWGGHEGGLHLDDLEFHCLREWRLDGRVILQGEKTVKTRGAVRKLCSALGVPLREPAAEGGKGE